MQKPLIMPLLLFALLLAACNSAAAPAVPAEKNELDGGSAAMSAGVENSEPAPVRNLDVVTGMTPEEAGIIREQDHVKGAEEPVVTIIEYGDFQ